MAVLRQALDDAMSGHGRLVMLAGEPGIGKTRTAQELASHAETQGARVLWGRCYEQEGAPPYWPWVQPIRTYVQETDPEELQSEMGPGAADIGEVIPEVCLKLPGVGAPPVMEPEQARFRLFDSITAFLKNASQSRPLVIVLDDLHWADKDSLLLLQFLARQLEGSQLLVVGCYRDVELSRQHPLSETLSELAREPVFRRELLRGLSRDDTGRYIQATVGQSPPRELVDRIHAHTEGNPFFMTEVLRLLSDRGELITEQADGVLQISVPESVREAIGQRLNRLSELCNQVLTTASVIGRQFDYRLLDAVTGGMTEEQGLTAIDEAVSAHLIEEVPGSTERFQFSHALIQRTLGDELTTTRRVRLHSLIAAAMEEQYGDDAEAHAAELAYHFGEGESVTGSGKLVRYSLLAGQRALATHAYDEAQALFQRGLTAKGVASTGNELVEDGDAAALLFGLGRTLASISTPHENQEVLDSLYRAFDYYERAGDVPSALAVAEYPHYTMLEYETTAVLVTRALALVPEESHGAGRLLASHGQILGLVQGDYDAAHDALNRALVIARREKDTTLELRTLAIAVSVDTYHFRWPESIERIPAVVQMARQADDVHAEVNAHYFATTALATMGDSALAGHHASAMLPPAERLRQRYWWTGALWKNMIVARLKGDWHAARDFGNRALEIDAEDFRLLGDWIMLEYELGEFQKGEAYLEQLIAHMHRTSPGPNMTYAYTATFTGFVSYITGAGNRTDMAKRTAGVILASPFSNPNVASRARVALSLLAVQAGDAESAGEQYSYLSSLRGTLLWFTISADRLLGMLANTMIEPDQAIAHFEDALTFCRKAGYRPELAWTCHDYADTLLQRNGDGDHTRAISLLDESLAISSELAMKPLMERVSGLQEIAEAQQVREPAYPDGLTPREVEVLRLVAEGKSNPEIGRELYISSNTVANHVRNILNKTDTPIRIAAAGYAMQRGLTS